MANRHLKILYRLLNLWLCFVVLLILSSYLPHWENVGFFTYLNYAFLFWLFLCVIAIALRERCNKALFINLSVLYGFNSLTYLNIFVGENYLFGDSYMAHHVYKSSLGISSFLYLFSILFIIVKMIFRKSPTWRHYAITALFSGIISGAVYFPYLNHVINGSGNSYTLFYKCISQFYMLTLVSIIFYGIYVYFKNVRMGEYINLIMTSLFFYSIADLVNYFSMNYDFWIYGIWLHILNSNAIFISILLYKKLAYTYSDFGQFYEGLLSGRQSMGKIRIIPRNQAFNSLALRVLKIYIYQRRHYLLTLGILLIAGIIYFEVPAFFTLNLLGVLLGLGIILIFYDALYKKRGDNVI